MAEILPSGGGEIISKDQQTPPALQELKKLIGPSNIAIITQAYEDFSDTQKISLLKKIQQNKNDISTFIDIEDSTSLQTLLKNIITEIIEDTKIKQEESTIRKEESGEKTTIKNMEVKESLLKEAREQRDAAYRIFGNEDGFNKKFGKDITRWREEATKKVLAEPGADKLSEEEKKIRIDISLLVTNREAIAAGLPEGAARTEFNGIAGKLNFLATELNISIEPRLVSIPITVDTKNQISTELIGLKPTDRVTQTGSEFKYGDQVVDISTRPPTRSTEQYGLRITPTGEKGAREQEMKKSFYEGNSEKEQKLTDLRTERTNIGNSIENETKYLQNIATNILKIGTIENLDEATYDQILQGLGKELQGVTKDSNEYADIDNLGKEIAKRKQEYLQPKGLKEQQARLILITSNIQAIEQQIKTDKIEYQKAIATFAESERSNLQTLNTFGIDLFGQDGAEAFLGQLNQQRKLQAKPLLELGTEFSGEMRNSIAIGFRDRILGSEGKSLIITNGNGDTTLSPEPGTRERITALLNQKGFNAKITNPTQKILEAFKQTPTGEKK